MLVKEVMEKPVCIGPDETLKTAAVKLKGHNAGCLLVCEGARVLGILTDRDVLIRGPASMRDLNQTTVREAMSGEIQCCSEDDSLKHAAELMSNNHVHRLPVLNAEGQLVGVVSLNSVDHGASQRAPVEVIFYKKITDSYGRVHHGEQRRIIIGPGHSREEAVGAALRRFEDEVGGSWKTFADGYDVLEVRPAGHGRIAEELTTNA